MTSSIRSRARAALLAAAGLALAGALQAAPLKIALVVPADDPRMERTRAEPMYPGHPGGPLSTAVEVALEETRFELEAAKLEAALETVEAKSADDAKAQLQKLEKAGYAAVLLDLPGAWVAAAAPAVKLPLVNVGSADDELRGAQCQRHLFHTLPGERMRADAMAQALTARKWQRVLVLAGPRPEDQARLATVQASMKRYGLKTVAVKAFKLSADPRERDLANPLLLTGPSVGEYDVVWVVDTDGEFARTLPYRIALPRPVVGDAGLTAQAWGPNFERFGAPQLARRFAREAKRPMTGHDWAAWIGTKAVLTAAMATASAPNAANVLKQLAHPELVLDGFKGTRTSFRAWDRQLRQPLLMTDGVGIIGIAPVDGIMHPRNVLDTLGADQPESACKAK